MIEQNKCEIMNNYNDLVHIYKRTNEKPDKKYSMLPTVMSLSGDIKSKRVVDLGCGDGFFTREFAKNGAGRVIGIDNSKEQLLLAEQLSSEDIIYKFGDIFIDNFPKADIINAPFVLNYAKTLQQLETLVKKIYDNLSEGGEVVSIVDLPSGKNLKKFGALKKIIGEPTDEAPIEIRLYNNEQLICKLNAVYYTKQTIENVFNKFNFKKVLWHKPIINEQAYKIFDKKAWEDYIDDCELGYLTAIK